VDIDANAHAFVADLETPELEDEDRHHLARVLRLRADEPITVSDGCGRWRRCRFGDPLEPSGPIERDEQLMPELSVAFALVKGERIEWTVQKLVEIGVDRIIPFTAERSVVRWDPAKSEQHHLRLSKIARQAAMQSRRVRLAKVEPLRSFAEVTKGEDVALADARGGPPSLTWPNIVIGPEGGWSEAERSIDLPRVRLATTVLRAETAALAAGAVLVALREGLVTSPDAHSPR
jgi:16S rRNA (uracil1498-N3)-methyltransferase